MNLTCLHELPNGSLRTLAVSLRQCSGGAFPSERQLEHVVGPSWRAVQASFQSCLASGLRPDHVATLVETIVMARESVTSVSTAVDLVLSGPDVLSVPTLDSAAVMHALIDGAREEVVIVGYYVHRVESLFERLANKMAANEGLRVLFYLDIARRNDQGESDEAVVEQFARVFVEKHWPWRPRPQVWYDPRALSTDPQRRASLHAKCLIADRRVALLTSANLTQAAATKNIEAGVVVRHPPLAERLVTYFEGLRETGVLKRCDLAQ